MNKNIKNLCFTILFVIIYACTPQQQEHVRFKELNVQAPFEMPIITIPDFQESPHFPITNYGAVPHSVERNTKAIAESIAQAHHAGGGVVVIPPGEWQTGQVHLESNVALYLSKGAILHFSDNPQDYLPAVHTSWEGIECYNYSPLIYAYNCKNIAIMGEGTLQAKMSRWEAWFERTSAHMNSLKRMYISAAEEESVQERYMVNDSSNMRPHFIQLNRCSNVLLDGFLIKNSPFWTIHPYMSQQVVIRNLKVYAHGCNNDGCDPEMSQDILIENCVFDQGDDAIAVKSGRNQDAWRLNKPSRNIVIKNCRVINGHQLLAIGSELSGGVENIFMDSCQVQQGAKLNHLLFIKTNERRGGYVNNITMSNVSAGNIDKGILGIETDVMYQWRYLVKTYARRLTPIKNIHLHNIHAEDLSFITKITGQQECPIDSVLLKQVSASSIQGVPYINENVLHFITE